MDVSTLLDPKKYRGVFALVPSCSTADGNSPTAKNTFDEEAQCRLVDKLLRDGVHGIITTGSVGECHTMTWDEQKRLIDTVVSTVKGRVPVVVGAWSINTREAIEKTKYAAEAGADAVISGVPTYLPLSVNNAVQYYADMADACPDIGIMIYSNPPVFRMTIPPEAYTKIKNIRTVVAVKETIKDVRHWFNICRICGDRVSVLAMCYMMFPYMMLGAKGCTSTSINAGPQPVLKAYEACLNKDWDTAREITSEINRITLESQEPMRRAHLDFSDWQVTFAKIMINASDYANVGPPRRPFAHIPKEVEESAVSFARMWTDLVKKYS